MAHPKAFPAPPPITNVDADEANYQNYKAWQAATQSRRRASTTQFNMFQSHIVERMCSQAAYKEELNHTSDQLKDMVERRLSKACECETCDEMPLKKERSNSDASEKSSSSARTSLSSIGSTSPPGTMVRGPTSPSSKNSLIVSPPPTSRHHKRRKQRSNVMV